MQSHDEDERIPRFTPPNPTKNMTPFPFLWSRPQAFSTQSLSQSSNNICSAHNFPSRSEVFVGNSRSELTGNLRNSDSVSQPQLSNSVSMKA